MQRIASLIESKYAYDRCIYGQNINVAVVDSGIKAHVDFQKEYISKLNRRIYGKNRLVAAYDAVNGKHMFYDDNGHGTHVAGIVGGYGNYFMGVAPACGLISVKVLDKYGNGRIEDVIRGIEWILTNKKKYDIRIVNISVGSGTERKYSEDSVLVESVDRLWDAGIIVLAAAGNNGPEPESIGAPGISRKIITVGASDDSIIYYGRYKKSIRDYSGRGPTKNCIMKPDIVAPGANVKSCSNVGYTKYTMKSGTSMSTPVVSGAIALLLSKEPGMNNRDVKLRLKNTAIDLGLPHEKQGWGLINVRTLIEGEKLS